MKNYIPLRHTKYGKYAKISNKIKKFQFLLFDFLEIMIC